MSTTFPAELTSQALALILVLSLPTILVATVAGVLISFLQAVTQIQEQTLSFAVKLLCVSVTLAGTSAWLGGELCRFAVNAFSAIALR